METEQFVCDSDIVYAETYKDEICINIEKPDEVYYSYMTKEQAIKFANQILKLCGKGDEEDGE